MHICNYDGQFDIPFNVQYQFNSIVIELDIGYFYRKKLIMSIIITIGL